MQPSTAPWLLVPVLLGAVLGPGCSFDAHPRPKYDDSSSGRAVTVAPFIDAATATPAVPSPPVAGGPGPAFEPPPGGGPAGAGAAPPVAMPSDAATPPSEPGPDADAPDDDAATMPDAAGGAGASDAMANDAMANDAGPSGATFHPCHAHGDCDPGLWCTAVAWGMPNEGGYCAALCPGASGAATCPQPASGSLTATCQPTTALCELGSCERQTCPEGLSCARIETPIGGGLHVSAFVCRP